MNICFYICCPYTFGAVGYLISMGMVLKRQQRKSDTWGLLHYKTVLRGIMNFLVKIRLSWDRLTFIMRILILVRRDLCIETGPWKLCARPFVSVHDRQIHLSFRIKYYLLYIDRWTGNDFVHSQIHVFLCNIGIMNKVNNSNTSLSNTIHGMSHGYFNIKEKLQSNPHHQCRSWILSKSRK